MSDFLPFTPDVIGDIRPNTWDDEDWIDGFDSPADFRGLCEMDGNWSDGSLYPEGFRVYDRCSRCGCTSRRACRDGGHGCGWVFSWRCSRCARFPERRRWRRPRRRPQAVALVRGRPPLPLSWPTVMRAGREGLGLWEVTYGSL